MKNILIKKAIAVSLLSVAATFTLPTLSATTSTDTVLEPAHPSETLSHWDKNFLEKATMTSVSQYTLSQLAAERASSPEVKAFADKLVADHTDMNTDLMILAGVKNLDVQAAISKGVKEDYKKLSQKTGKDFDEAYIRYILRENKQSSALFSKVAGNATNDDIRAIGTKYLPVLTADTEQVKGISKTVN